MSIICLYLFVQLKTLPRMKSVFRVLVMSFFVYGQIGAIAHAHDHEHEGETHHKVCEYCILAFTDEGDVSDVVDRLDGPDLIGVSNISAFETIFGQGESVLLSQAQENLSELDRFSDFARAPPSI